MHKRPGADVWGVDPDIEVLMSVKQVSDAISLRQSSEIIPLDDDGDLDPNAPDRPDVSGLLSEGIDVVLSSHLLEEVERIADNVVIIADGTVAAAGPIDDLQTGRGGLIVVVTAKQDEVAAALRATGLDVRDDGSRLIVGAEHGADELADVVRDAIATVGAPLRRLSPMQNSLEDIFLAEVHGA